MLGALSIEEFCNNTASILQYVGYALTIVKVVIPLLIIAFGVLDFGKAVVASKDDEIKTSAKRLLWRAIAGVVIFFIPSIVLWLFGTVQQYSEAEGNGFGKCKDCILTPWECSPGATSKY